MSTLYVRRTAQFESLKPMSRYQHEHEFNKTEDFVSQFINVTRLVSIPRIYDIKNYQDEK